MQSPKGQTLLESLLAIAVIAIGIIGLITLLISVRTTGEVALAESQALQLGQEALEAARYIRDSNWLKYEDGQAVDYSTNLRATADYTASYNWDPTITDDLDAAIQFGFEADSITDDFAIVYQDTAGYYRQGQNLNDWTQTSFRRLITFSPLCVETTTGEEQVMTNTDCSAMPTTTEIGTQVTVHIRWVGRGQTHERYYETKLYNWKYAQAT